MGKNASPIKFVSITNGIVINSTSRLMSIMMSHILLKIYTDYKRVLAPLEGQALQVEFLQSSTDPALSFDRFILICANSTAISSSVLQLQYFCQSTSTDYLAHLTRLIKQCYAAATMPQLGTGLHF